MTDWRGASRYDARAAIASRKALRGVQTKFEGVLERAGLYDGRGFTVSFGAEIAQGKYSGRVYATVWSRTLKKNGRRFIVVGRREGFRFEKLLALCQEIRQAEAILREKELSRAQAQARHEAEAEVLVRSLGLSLENERKSLGYVNEPLTTGRATSGQYFQLRPGVILIASPSGLEFKVQLPVDPQKARDLYLAVATVLDWDPSERKGLTLYDILLDD